MNPSIHFVLPVNASPADAACLIDAIAKQFGVTLDAGVDPASLPVAPPQATTAEPAAPAMDATDIAVANLTGSDLDATGLPWDERIHSGNKAKNADGTWRKKRGVDDGTFLKIAASLRSTVSAPAAPVATSAPAAPPVAPPVAPPAAPPAPPAPAVDPAYSALVDFIAANSFDATSNPTGRITPDYLSQVLAHYGVADGSLQNLAHRPDLVTVVHDWLKTAITA